MLESLGIKFEEVRYELHKPFVPVSVVKFGDYEEDNNKTLE